MRNPKICGELALERLDLGAQHEPAALDDLAEPCPHFRVMGSLPSLQLE
jgi:hypothetical protein